MANLSSFLARPSGNRAPPPGPGSNGFFRREFFIAGATYPWVALKSGRVKLQGFGTGSGGGAFNNEPWPGCSGAFGEKTFDVLAGQTLNLVVGLGSAGASVTTSPISSARAETTSVSGDPLPTPLVLEGAQGHTIAGIATGPWDVQFPGASPLGSYTGSPSSGSPFGAGKTSRSQASPGWGENLTVANDQLTFSGSVPHGSIGAPVPPYLTAPTTPPPWWDIRDILNLRTAPVYNSLVAAEGVGSPRPSGTPRRSVLGGGTAAQVVDAVGEPGGIGAGGGGAGTRSQRGGKGGDALIILFWDEVTS